jgi:predicted RNase H-like nuclease (RuvC/YqgF family)
LLKKIIENQKILMKLNNLIENSEVFRKNVDVNFLLKKNINQYNKPIKELIRILENYIKEISNMLKEIKDNRTNNEM